METEGREARFIGEQMSEGKRQRGREEVFTGEHGAKEGGMDG